MPATHYDWSGDRLPTIDRHSMAKHNILASYVRRYINVLMQNPRIPKIDITLVDGFAGGGAYSTESGEIWYGSPVVLLQAIENAIHDINFNRREQRIVNAEFVFIEERRANFQSLNRVLFEKGYTVPNERIHLIQGSFEQKLDGLLRQICERHGKSHRVIFVLDQYGYTDVCVNSVRKIFTELPNSEIFLTLAVEYILRYRRELGTAAAELCRGLRINDPHMEILLNNSISDDTILATNGTQRNGILRALQRLLHDIFTKKVNATYYTPFFISSAKNWSSYWFLHLANSYRANDVVKALHWSCHNHFKHFGDSGFNMLGYDPKKETPQSSFDFDAHAEERTRIALIKEIPRYLRENLDSRRSSVREIYAARCNETPADLKIFQSAIQMLCISGELDKQGARGENRRAATAVKGDDLISTAVQKTFVFDFGANHR